MTNPVAILHTVIAGDTTYSALWFWCPGCETRDEEDNPRGGLHSLPVNTTITSPSWDWDGNIEAPTLSPSILTQTSYYTGPDTPPRPFVCHSFLRAGVFEFLGDCTHELVNQYVPIPPLPDWVVKERT